MAIEVKELQASLSDNAVYEPVSRDALKSTLFAMEAISDHSTKWHKCTNGHLSAMGGADLDMRSCSICGEIDARYDFDEAVAERALIGL